MKNAKNQEFFRRLLVLNRSQKTEREKLKRVASLPILRQLDSGALAICSRVSCPVVSST